MDYRIEQYNNWKYKINYSNIKNKFEIKYPENISIPKTLSKYYAINKHSIESLENNNFYVSEPEDFNDLFDTAYDILDFNHLEIENVLSLFNQENQNTYKTIWNKNKSAAINLLRQEYRKAMLTKFGILCTTVNKFDDLMWGYYNKNEGFLIEFNYDKFSKCFHGPFPVNYVTTIEKIKVKSFDHLNYLIQSNIKKDIWKHENEFRFLVESNSAFFRINGIWKDKNLEDILENNKSINFIDRKVDYPSQSIKALYLGYNFLKGEDILQTNYPYKIRLISENKELKKRLLMAIIDQNIECYTIIQNVANFKLKTEKWAIKFIDEYEIEIKAC